MPAEFGWSDLGSWGSLRTLLPQDEDGNVKVGKDIRLYDCKNCVVHADDESKVVVVQGLDGYIVAKKHGQLLVLIGGGAENKGVWYVENIHGLIKIRQ